MKKQKQIISWLLVIILIIGAVWTYKYGTKIEIPIVAEDGKIDGNYSIESILTLNKPLKCTFEKRDENSKINGTIYTDGKQIAADFRIQTDIDENKLFNSFLIIKDKQALTWTDLSPLGFKTSVVKSASQNASPADQAQLIGTRDKIPLKCSPWKIVDDSLFKAPSNITFTSF